MDEIRILENLWSDWRRNMLPAVGTRDRVLELESHVRDAMDHEMAAGMDELSAFKLCARNLGSPQEFAMQYPQPVSRANRIALWSVRAVWFLGFLVAAFYLAKVPRLSTFHVFFLMMGYWTILCSLPMGLWVWFAVRETDAGETTGQVFKKEMIRMFAVSTLTFTLGTWLGMVWSRENLGAYWQNDPKELVCAVITLVSGACLLLAWRRDPSPRRMASLALLAFGVAVWCYCLPLYWMVGNLDHSYGGDSRWYLAGALLVLTLILSGIALAGFLPRKTAFPLLAKDAPSN